MIVDLSARSPSPLSGVTIEQFGGAIGQVGVTESAFPARTATYNFVITARWLDRQASDDNIRWTREFFDAMQPYAADTVYVNYLEAGAEGDRRIREVIGPNYERLVAVKNQYDPSNLFRVNQNVRPTV